MDYDSICMARERPDGVNKKRLPELSLDATIPIYYKPSSKSPNIQLIAAFPKEALTLFSKAALQTSRKTQDNEEKFDLYQVRGGDTASLKTIFEWIQDCLDQQSITKFPDLPEPEDDPYGPTLKAMEAANILDIPAGSLQFFLAKRLEFIACKALMPFSQVREFYTVDSEPYQAGLKDVACASIFNAWWDYRLDATVDAELMGELTDLRLEFPELDADLHKACKNKEDEIAKRKLEKKLKRENENQAFNSNGGFQDWQQEHNAIDAGQDDWENNASVNNATWDGAKDWDKENETAGTGNLGWDKAVTQHDGTSKDPGNDEKAVLDWADESAAEHEIKSQGPVASVSPGGW